MKLFFSHRIILIGLLLIYLMAGCKTSEKVGTVDTGAAKAHAEFFDSMEKQSFQFRTLSARMNVDLNIPGKEMSSRVDLKMVKDSAFLLSVQPILGIELFRLEMNTDSIKIIDRMNKRYVAENYTNLKNQTPIAFNFFNLQALFINHIFVPGEKGISQKEYHRFLLNQEGNRAEVKIKDSMGLLYTFLADGEEKLLSTHITNDTESYALQWIYKDFRLNDKQPFPMMMDANIYTDNTFRGGITINFNRIQTNIPVQVEASIPDKYRRITLADILKIVGNSNN